MNLIEQKLTSLAVGSPVRLTQSNGQIIEGVISKNDRTTALEVTVTAKVTMMYSQIAGIEENSAFGISAVPIQTAMDKAFPLVKAEGKKDDEELKKGKKTQPEIKTNIKFTCTEYDLKNSFGRMTINAKNEFSSILNKVTSAIKNHDKSKFSESVGLAWNIIEDNEYEDNPEVNRFYAYVCAFADEYRDSAISFYYADEVRNAYRVSFHGASKTGDAECYMLSAAFAAIYCKDKDNEFIDEAVEVIKFSSEKCRDISAVKYLISLNPTDSLGRLLVNSMNYLAARVNIVLSAPNDLKKSVSELEPYYSDTKIIDEIKSYNYEEETAEKEVVPVSVPAPSVGEGRITGYNFFEGKGKVTAVDGKVYEYELSGIADSKLRANLKAISKCDPSKTIPVKFKTSRKMGSDYAVDIIRIEEKPNPASEPAKKDPHLLYTQGRYEEAIKIYREELENEVTDVAFSQIILSYLALWNKNGDLGYTSELEKFTSKHADSVPKTTKSLESLQQYYMKIHDYSKSLGVVNSLLECCDSNDYGRILHYILGKERCYRNLGDYQSAVGQLQDWLDIVKRNKITDRYDLRQASIFIELAELYYELEDYGNAEKFANDASDSERRQSILKKLDALKEPAEKETDDFIDEDDSENEESTMSLSEAYGEYTDDAGFNGLGISDADVVEKIAEFDKKHLYCLIAWLTAVSETAKKSDIKGESVLHSELTMLQSIQSIENAFSYAYHSPLSECEYTSTRIVNLYEATQNLLPEYNEGLMVSAVLRTLFNPLGSQDYYLEDLICVIETSDISEKYPMLVNLISEMKKFYDNTGCAIDAFAGYRSNVNVIDNVIKEAKELCDTIDKKNDVFESQGQVRRLRETMFSDEQSELRKCLNIVAENNISEFKYVRSCMEKTFIRNNRPLSADNADIMKIDMYIDEYWDKARDIIISEKRHISRPHDKIKGSKRTNIINTIRKIISCVCEWLAVAEHSGNAEEAYILKNYDAVAPQIISMMKELYSAGSRSVKENGKFQWPRNETEALLLTTQQRRWLLEGLKIEQPKAIQEGRRSAVY